MASKIKLNVGALEVESFHTAVEGKGAAGTIAAYTGAQATCLRRCFPYTQNPTDLTYTQENVTVCGCGGTVNSDTCNWGRCGEVTDMNARETCDPHCMLTTLETMETCPWP